MNCFKYITIMEVAVLRLLLCGDQTSQERPTVVGTRPHLWPQTMMAVLKLSTKSATTPAPMAGLVETEMQQPQAQQTISMSYKSKLQQMELQGARNPWTLGFFLGKGTHALHFFGLSTPSTAYNMLKHPGCSFITGSASKARDK